MGIPLVVPVPSRQTIGEMVVNKSTQYNVVLRAYTNNVTPAVGTPSGGSTAGSFTEASGGGYAAITLTGASWTSGNDGTSQGQLSYATQTWTFSGALSGSATIYGIFVTQATGGLLIFAGRDSSPFTPATSGDTYAVTPVFLVGGNTA